MSIFIFLFGGFCITDFSNKLKELRVAKKVTQKNVADYIEVPESSYQRYEYGKHEPRYEILVKLADFFDVTTDYLLGRTDDI